MIKIILTLNTWVKNTRMLNGDVDIISLETLCNLSTTVKNSIFIRPIGDLKTFTGQILQSHDIYSFVDGLIKRGITYDTNVSLSGVKNILAEWRYFIVNGVIITGSTYRIDNKVVCRNESDSEILSKAQKLADKWLPNRCCCMDVAKTSKGLTTVAR